MTTEQKMPKMLSDRTFGLIFAGIFLIIACYPVLFGNSVREWALIIAALWAVPAIIFPKILNPLNKAWLKFGFFMHGIINPILMGIVFWVAVFPTGLILKALGKDPMHRKLEPDAQTYWKVRETQPSKESFNDQF
jgi:hypothetical protein